MIMATEKTPKPPTSLQLGTVSWAEFLALVKSGKTTIVVDVVKNPDTKPTSQT